MLSWHRIICLNNKPAKSYFNSAHFQIATIPLVSWASSVFRTLALSIKFGQSLHVWRIWRWLTLVLSAVVLIYKHKRMPPDISECWKHTGTPSVMPEDIIGCVFNYRGWILGLKLQIIFIIQSSVCHSFLYLSAFHLFHKMKNCLYLKHKDKNRSSLVLFDKWFNP